MIANFVDAFEHNDLIAIEGSLVSLDLLIG